jgi:hypothetical protein
MRYWKKLDLNGLTRTVESYSHNLDIKGAIKITENEFNQFIDSLPQSTSLKSIPQRIDELENRIKAIERRR